MRAPDVGLDHARIGDDFARNARLDHFAVAEHQHAVADAGDDVHVVLDDQHRDAALVPRVQDEAGHVGLFLLVHAGHRLVQDQEARLGHQGPRQFHALLDAQRQ
jgi:hypothetical protein